MSSMKVKKDLKNDYIMEDRDSKSEMVAYEVKKGTENLREFTDDEKGMF